MKYVAVTSFTHNGKSISDGYVIDKAIYGYTDADIYYLVTQGKVKAVDNTVKQNITPQKVQAVEEKVKVAEETVPEKVKAVEEKVEEEEEVKVVDDIKTFSFSKKSKKK